MESHLFFMLINSPYVLPTQIQKFILNSVLPVHYHRYHFAVYSLLWHWLQLAYQSFTFFTSCHGLESRISIRIFLFLSDPSKSTFSWIYVLASRDETATKHHYTPLDYSHPPISCPWFESWYSLFNFSFLSLPGPTEWKSSNK